MDGCGDKASNCCNSSGSIQEVAERCSSDSQLGDNGFPPRAISMSPDKGSALVDQMLASQTPHCHEALPELHRSKKMARRKLIFAACFCFVFMISECVGGKLSGSMAVVTDGVHLFTDFTGYALNLFALYLGSKPPSKKYTLGWHRAEIMGALTSVLMIWMMTIVLCYLAILRIIHADFEIATGIMVIYAALGVGVNITIGLILSNFSSQITGCLSGSKKPAEEDYLLAGTACQSCHWSKLAKIGSGKEKTKCNDQSPEAQSINLRMAYIHVIGDCIQSIVVLITALIIYFKPEYKLADPICTIIFTLLVFSTTIFILKTIVKVIMESVPESVEYDELKDSLLQVPGVKGLHNLKAWALTTGRTAMSVHISADDSDDWHQMVMECSLRMRKDYEFGDVTVQVERHQLAIEACKQCADPVE